MKGERWQGCRILIPCIVWGICAGSIGCGHHAAVPQEEPIPRELRMTTLPPYVIEPPDILLITTLRVVPKPPYHIQTLDGLFIQATGTPETQPIRGIYTVDPNGTINLGFGYPRVQVSGLTIEEAQKEVQTQLAKILKETQVDLSLAQSRGLQQIQGDHLVRMDGTIGLGVYGSVYVTGMTLDQARQAIETHLGQFIDKPEISLDIFSYNSKWYYIIQDRAGYGQTVVRLPITGRDTVLDALSYMYGTLAMSSNKHMWLARPNGQNHNSMQIFPINWPALTQGGSPATNYQLLPGDRLYVQSNPWIKLNNRMFQFLAPFNQMLGFELLGTSAVSATAGTVFEIQSGSTGAGLAGSGVGVVR
jgi:polysaccharide biosynthesis/export protein